MIVRGEDVAFFVECISKKGTKCVGLTGEDLFCEYQLKNPSCETVAIQTIPWVQEGAMFGKPTLCLLGPIGGELNNLDKNSVKQTVAISSKYKSIANKYLAKLEKKGVSFDKIFLTGSVETAAKVGIATFVIDIVSSGRSAREAGLMVYDKLMESNVVLVGVRE
ncbi:MAG: hypothetical protein WC746_05925 [archaeon]|jgi:ATP phosphoribosyltransferase